METMRNGKFSHNISGGMLAKGLRMTERAKRNEPMLVACAGAVGIEGALSVLDELDRITTTDITDSFPYPQLFVFTNHIIVCSSTKIYEYVAGALVEKLEVTAGATWKAVDFHDFIYLSNGKVSVERSISSGAYSLSSLPVASAMCNFNGQIVIGAPDVEVT